jgi:MFS family permease
VTGSEQAAAPVWSAWRTVVWFGIVSLAADMVYEGARAVTGPFLASLGASALVVGLVTGAGEAAALAFRLVSGPWADRSGRYWSFTLVGYGLTAVCVPLLAVAPFLGAAGLAVACTLVLAERTGKAIRSPSKSTLLAHAAGAVGRGRGFGVHKALDQVGAFAGPLLVAGLIALTGRAWVGLAALAVPGAVAMALLLWIRREVPDVTVYDVTVYDVAPAAGSPRGPAPGAGPGSGLRSGAGAGSGLGSGREQTDRVRARLPLDFHLFSLASAGVTLGLMTFGVMSYHLVTDGLVSAAAVPLVYAAAMAVEAVTALGTGWAYDRVGPRVLLVLPVLVAAVPALVFSPSLPRAVVGVLLWGGATGILESTVKALVADLVPRAQLATAYGQFAALMGVAALAGGGLAGWLYAGGVSDLVAVVAVVQLLALGLLVRTTHRARRTHQ